MRETSRPRSKFQSLFESRRFWIFVAGVVANFSKEFLGVEVDEQTIQNITLLAISWIAGDTLRRTE